jgi:hypothetical protein
LLIIIFIDAVIDISGFGGTPVGPHMAAALAAFFLSGGRFV